jgi:transposase
LCPNVATERDEVYWLKGTITHLEAMVEGLEFELHLREVRLKEKDRYIAELEQQVRELKKQAAGGEAGSNAPPVKPDVPRRRRRKPGREPGHEPALRPMPPKIDRHQQVPLQRGAGRRAICPHCRCRLTRLRKRKRIVEDLIPSAVETTCYHTEQGYCPNCRRKIESRAPEQPPAADIAHGQLGINALATAAILRVRHRLPYRQITQLLLDLPGLHVSPAGLLKQVKRLARWLGGKYQDLIGRMRASPHVHVDETGWRIDGRNFWLGTRGAANQSPEGCGAVRALAVLVDAVRVMRRQGKRRLFGRSRRLTGVRTRRSSRRGRRRLG